MNLIEKSWWFENGYGLIKFCHIVNPNMEKN